MYNGLLTYYNITAKVSLTHCAEEKTFLVGKFHGWHIERVISKIAKLMKKLEHASQKRDTQEVIGYKLE